jgi:hypothetical protein
MEVFVGEKMKPPSARSLVEAVNDEFGIGWRLETLK